MITGIGHIGILVRNIDSAVDRFCQVLELPKPDVRDIKERQLKVAVLELGGAQVEFIEIYSQSAHLSEMKQDRPNVVHHIALLTDDIRSDVISMAKKGVNMSEDTPKLGVRNKMISFVSSGLLDGVLIELTEP